jgi:hypothetical protein
MEETRKMSSAVLTAALAGVPSGLQAQGVWQGRRQLFVRFAAEAETATMYRADALAREIDRIAARSHFHSIAITGRDVLGNTDFLAVMLGGLTTPLPAMIDCDGERPEAIEAIRSRLALVQVTLEIGGDGRSAERPAATLRAAAEAGLQHALTLVARDDASDAQILRIVEQAHAASAQTSVVLHPGTPGERTTLERRWASLMEQAAAVHPDVRLALRLPGPAALK